jgi:hypothetical protein
MHSVNGRYCTRENDRFERKTFTKEELGACGKDDDRGEESEGETGVS